jgi:hypothetical protein
MGVGKLSFELNLSSGRIVGVGGGVNKGRKLSAPTRREIGETRRSSVTRGTFCVRTVRFVISSSLEVERSKPLFVLPADELESKRVEVR